MRNIKLRIDGPSKFDNSIIATHFKIYLSMIGFNNIKMDKTGLPIESCAREFSNMIIDDDVNFTIECDGLTTGCDLDATEFHPPCKKSCCSCH